MLELMNGKLGENHSGELHQEAPSTKLNRLVFF